MTELLVVLGAAVGAPLRFVLAEWLDEEFPTGTLIVNVVASALLGLFSALALSDSAAALLGTGFCGGMSTYSAFAVQTHRAGRRLGSVYAVATIVLSVAACALGFWIGQA
ncbi:MAG TPA: CrcB family protein [Nocardioides sp.]|nr:CrcB family protein [Nocardioides sp.]